LFFNAYGKNTQTPKEKIRQTQEIEFLSRQPFILLSVFLSDKTGVHAKRKKNSTHSKSIRDL
jgi:hypothetical protein